MDANHSDILIVGAGMAGLACATQLAREARSIRVLDKGRGPGGRMAARRTEIAGAVVSFDHGAQYFTARSSGFQDAVSDWHRQGIVDRWEAAGPEAWVGVPGMNAPIRAMAASLDVHWSTRAETIERSGSLWSVATQDTVFTANTLLIAVPAEQAAVLLSQAAPELAEIARSVQSEPCWAVMASFDSSLGAASDIFRDPDAAVSWAARNSAKPGRSSTESWVLHASPDHSRSLIDADRDTAAQTLLDDFFAQTGIEPAVPSHLTAHRWLYAMPNALSGDPARFDHVNQIGIAGDYLHSPRVEGAWISGHALAEAVLSAA